MQIPRGRVIFGLFDEGSFNVIKWIDLGNCPEFTFSLSVESVSQKDSIKGTIVAADDFVTSKRCNFRLVVDNISKSNMELWFHVESFPQFTLMFEDRVESMAFNNGGLFALSRVPVSTVVVRRGTGEVLVSSVDYAMDQKINSIILANHIVGTVDVSYKTLNHSGASVLNSGIEGKRGELRFFSNNPIGENVRLIVPVATLKPSGDFRLIGDSNLIEWNRMTFDGVGLNPDNTRSLFELFFERQHAALEIDGKLLTAANGKVVVT